jgi:hypothetical protein
MLTVQVCIVHTDDDMADHTDDVADCMLTWKIVQMMWDTIRRRGRHLLNRWHMMCFGSKWECDTWPNQRPPCVTCLFVKNFALSGSRPHDLRG